MENLSSYDFSNGNIRIELTASDLHVLAESIVERVIEVYSDRGLRVGARCGDDVSCSAEFDGGVCSMFDYMKAIVTRLRRNGRVRTSETYEAALRSFHKYRGGNDISVDRLSSDIVEGYEAWLYRIGVTSNTVSFYMRVLRAAYNRAVEDGITRDRHPFRHVYIGIDKTVKRALPIKVIRKIRQLDLSTSPALDFARDMFMLSFMMRGMSFIDMAYLRKADLVDGWISYRRRKTGQLLTVRWTPEMQSILDKYPPNSSDYLLPVIRCRVADDRSVYLNACSRINYALKRIAAMIGIAVPLTLYVARHSWASAARSKGIPLGVISQGMGHNSESTTRIYLSGIDTSIVDNANRLILASI